MANACPTVVLSKSAVRDCSNVSMRVRTMGEMVLPMTRINKCLSNVSRPKSSHICSRRGRGRPARRVACMVAIAMAVETILGMY